MNAAWGVRVTITSKTHLVAGSLADKHVRDIRVPGRLLLSTMAVRETEQIPRGASTGRYQK